VLSAGGGAALLQDLGLLGRAATTGAGVSAAQSCSAGSGIAAVAAKFGNQNAQIFTRAAQIIQSGKNAHPNISVGDQRAIALGEAVAEAVPNGQVWAIGSYQGQVVYGTVRSGLGIVTVQGQTLIVRATQDGVVDVLGPLL
jgi:hypothetical protein